MNSIQILDETQIIHKTKRMAYEIWEHNTNEKEIYIFGIENAGAIVAKNIVQVLKKISPLKVTYFPLSINKHNLLDNQIDLPIAIKGKSIILIDDVANSGKTLLFALKPFLNEDAKKITIAVLVDRNHKLFPIHADIVGHTVSTTLQDQIIVKCEREKITGAFLE